MDQSENRFYKVKDNSADNVRLAHDVLVAIQSAYPGVMPASVLEAINALRNSLGLSPEHVASKDCWCEPEAQYTDPATGVTVWVHREIQ